MRRFVYILVAALSLPQLAYADWINLTGAETAPNIAEITVAEKSVEIALEIYLEDVDSFRAAERIALTVEADGVDLDPIVVIRERRTRKDRISPFAGMIDIRTRQRIPGPPEDDRVLFLKLRYEFSDQPGRLTFTPPLDEAGVAKATIGFIAYHKAVPLNDFRYLSRAETLVLNWDDPWFSTFQNRNLSRHHKWPQMSFLYIEPREVRHEVLVRVRDLMEWTQAQPDTQKILSADDKRLLQQAAREFFSERNPLRIDETIRSVSAFSSDYLRITPSGLQVIERDESVDASVAILGVRHSYWTKSLPRNVSVEWQLFDERIDRVPTSVIDPAGPFPSFVTPDDSRIEWQNFLKNYQEPVVHRIDAGDGMLTWSAIRLAVFGTPDEETATRCVQSLLENAAVAFLERDPEALDAALLSIVVDGALEDVRTELARAFAVPTRGGGVAAVEAIENLELTRLGELKSADGFTALAGWVARATGQHWGHVDKRKLFFRAQIDVGRVEGDWKLVGLTIIESRDPSAVAVR